MKILLIQTAFIGDVILTTPLIESLLKSYNAPEIHVVTTQAGSEILSGLPVHAHVLDKKNFWTGMKALFNSIGSQSFEAVFCVHRSPRSLLIGRRAKARRRFTFDSIFATLLGYETIAYPEYNENTHYSEKPLELLKLLQSPTVTKKPKLSAHAQKAKTAYFLVSPFSVWGTKNWPYQKFAQASAELSKIYNLTALLTGGVSPREKELSSAIEKTIIEMGGKVDNMVGKTSLEDLKSLVQQARFVLTNDSAAVHIASAFDVPTVAIFGPTVKKWGFFPLASKSMVVEKKDLPCRPCSLHGPMECPLTHFKCMNEIQVEEVVKAVNDLGVQT